MENINLDGLTYEQLCELENALKNTINAIAEKKKNFVSLESLSIYNGMDGEPHLCYRTYTCDYCGFWDIFNNYFVVKKPKILAENSFLSYLTSNNIDFEDKRYSKEELASLWKPIRIKLLIDELDKEQTKLDEEQERLDNNRKQLQLLLTINPE